MLETAQSIVPANKPKRHLRSWKRRKNDRPVEILAAVKAAVAEHGIENVRMGDIANRANVSKGTLYCYFTSKAELLAFVGREPLEHEAGTVPSI
jgi:AcrR family transcriptional regulator